MCPVDKNFISLTWCCKFLPGTPVVGVTDTGHTGRGWDRALSG